MKRISLRARVLLVVASLLLISVAGGLVSLWLIHRMELDVSRVVNKNVAAYDIAQKLETALVMQKGLLTYYFLDNDPGWLTQLEAARTDFEDSLRKAREVAYTEHQRVIVNDIESGYIRYGYGREKVIGLYQTGHREAGFNLHKEIRDQFLKLRQLCLAYRGSHEEMIIEARNRINNRAVVITTMVWTGLPTVVILGIALSYILIRKILEPIRQLANETDAAGGNGHVMDEVKALSRRVYSLIEDVDSTQTQLQLSQEHLIQSEKLAMVGKLAAGVAHTIRNPLTSVKMRLFSMERSMSMAPEQKDDFEVISEEIRHIDNIVRNFLEYSRPPKLKPQLVSLSDVVDMAIQLLRHRLESYGVELDLIRQKKLSEIEGDPEQLKEVLVNLIVNACEAMVQGGKIVIREEEGLTDHLGRVAVVRLSDNGPGIPEAVRERIFQPFFSTKEEGTGLGLSIAARIIEDHRGCLNVKSRPGRGATFTITLPCQEDKGWLRS